MLFNSFDFLFFFVGVTIAHFALPSRNRWLLLLLASCGFYMFFIPEYIIILGYTIVLDYYAAIAIAAAPTARTKRIWLWLSVVSVCGTLFVFKYFNFFAENARTLAHLFNIPASVPSLRLILPIGLSFHTFQSLSYVVEVYRGRQAPERHFGIYALYVMYFPQLVAGPIERPQNLLHQLHDLSDFDARRTADGLLLVLWGLFKKVVVADCFAVYVDAAYADPTNRSGATLLLATYLFAFQIYCDFSGYSDIARGVSRVYGVELMRNFRSPYFATSVSEFWTRWHISLSTWFKDYVYVPLGGNRVGALRAARNIMIVFVISGLWHGANWTFVFWGVVHGSYLLFEQLLRRGRRPAPATGIARFVRILLTFHLVLLGWVFFRAKNCSDAFVVLARVARLSGPVMRDDAWLAQGVIALCVVLAIEALLEWRPQWLNERRGPVLRSALAIGLLFSLILFGVDRSAGFIYFQF